MMEWRFPVNRRSLAVSLLLVLVAVACESNGTAERSATTMSTTGPAATPPRAFVSTTETPTTPLPLITTITPTTPTTTAPEPLRTTTITPTPALEVTYPRAGEHVGERVIRFEGTTDPGCAVTASGRYEAEVDTAGNWRVVLVLRPGGNLVSINADDQRGPGTEVRVPVFYDPPLVLRPDGLGLVKFGDPVEPAVDQLTAMLGPPSSDRLLTPADLPEGVGLFVATGYPAIDYARFMSWDRPQLHVMFSDQDPSGGSWEQTAPYFNGWVYVGPGAPLGPVLSTPEGVEIGASVADLRAAYGSDLWLQTESEAELAGWHWTATSSLTSIWWPEETFVIRGHLDRDPLLPGSAVSQISAGFGLDEC